MNHSIVAKLGFLVIFCLLCHVLNARPGDLPEGKILYYEESKQGSGHLVLLDLSTGGRQQVGRSGSRPDHFPSWSADGRNMVFESYRKGGWHVWVAGADGSKARRLSNLPDYNTRYYEFDPAFSPDNRTVIFVQGDDLWTVTLDNPTPKRLTPENNGIWETAPVYSPDGREIAIAGHDDESKAWNIYTLKSDGSGFRQLSSGQGKNFAPQWSPDSRHILFYSNRNGSFELYEMTRAGNEVHPVFDQEQLKSAGFVKTALINPWDNNWGATEQYRTSYSTDGQWIVFSRDVDGDRELFVAQRDGSTIIRITHRTGLDGQPAWRPVQ